MDVYVHISYVYIYIHTYTHIYIYTCIYIYTHVCNVFVYTIFIHSFFYVFPEILDG